MGLISWAIVGLLAAWIAGMVTGRKGRGCITNIAVGVIGAFIGGALARAAGYEGIRHFGLRSVLLAALGATVFLGVLGAIEGRRRPLDGNRRRIGR
ncbi:MAG: GlsB/YeaQ/YmgE family stress response membrane protein [Actinobacteria bacterium]|nr:GlsB/YeaQ/YmgE family stress response membrane protein [Actinomycetota bacterium]MBV9933854.1 GlsB/YeaQ/YmgE family stress response membrane protein [Actinomycetota bacterium]